MSVVLRHVAVRDTTRKQSSADELARLLTEHGIDFTKPVLTHVPYDRSVTIYYNEITEEDVVAGFMVDEVVV